MPSRRKSGKAGVSNPPMNGRSSSHALRPVIPSMPTMPHGVPHWGSAGRAPTTNRSQPVSPIRPKSPVPQSNRSPSEGSRGLNTSGRASGIEIPRKPSRSHSPDPPPSPPPFHQPVNTPGPGRPGKPGRFGSGQSTPGISNRSSRPRKSRLSAGNTGVTKPGASISSEKSMSKPASGSFSVNQPRFNDRSKNTPRPSLPPPPPPPRSGPRPNPDHVSRNAPTLIESSGKPGSHDTSGTPSLTAHTWSAAVIRAQAANHTPSWSSPPDGSKGHHTDGSPTALRTAELSAAACAGITSASTTITPTPRRPYWSPSGINGPMKGRSGSSACTSFSPTCRDRLLSASARPKTARRCPVSARNTALVSGRL